MINDQKIVGAVKDQPRGFQAIQEVLGIEGSEALAVVLRRSLDSLERRGYIRREFQTSRKGKRRYIATDKGRALIESHEDFNSQPKPRRIMRDVTLSVNDGPPVQFGKIVSN